VVNITMNTTAKTNIKPDAINKRARRNGLRGRDWVREIARQRDKRTCQMCGRQWVEGQRRFDVHHIVGCGYKSMHYDRIEELDNLITYCHKCHLGLHVVRRKIKMRQGQQKLNRLTKRNAYYNKV
jgi:hypothetical protein